MFKVCLPLVSKPSSRFVLNVGSRVTKHVGNIFIKTNLCNLLKESTESYGMWQKNVIMNQVAGDKIICIYRSHLEYHDLFLGFFKVRSFSRTATLTSLLYLNISLHLTVMHFISPPFIRGIFKGLVKNSCSECDLTLLMSWLNVMKLYFYPSASTIMHYEYKVKTSETAGNLTENSRGLLGEAS